jgi:hypothetical protein
MDNVTPRPTVRERVAAGAAWLDQEAPEWREIVETGNLDIMSGVSCVLGQVSVAMGWTWDYSGTTGYHGGIEHALGEDSPFGEEAAVWARVHGFLWIAFEELPYDSEDGLTDFAREALNDAARLAVETDKEALTEEWLRVLAVPEPAGL